MTRRSESLSFALFLVGVFLLFLILALGLESPGRIGAILVAAGSLALASVQFIRQLNNAGSIEPAWTEHEVSSLAWVLAMPLAIYVLGCLAAAGLHTGLFLRTRGGRSWPTAVACGLAAAGAVYGLSVWMLRPELRTGLLWGG